MHIAIDISPLESSHKFRGVGSYTQSLIDALQKYEKNHRYSFFSGNPTLEDVDIVHYPYFDPFFLTLPLRKIKPTIVTVHDLIPLVYPDKFPAGLRGSVKWKIQKLFLRRCDGIITDSHASKEDVKRIVGIPDKKISVVYLAPSEAFHPQIDPVALKSVRKTYRLSEKYILYVGDINWNKNIIGLLQAFALVRKNKPEMKLVLVGKAFLEEFLAENKEIRHFIHNNSLTNDIIMTGKVTSEELMSLYSLATVYVQPSHYEGFGLPVLEAMSCGCPVVSSGTSSLKEIVGPGIMTGTAPESIALGIQKALGLDPIIQARSQSMWVERFTWKSMAHETVQVYENS